MSDYSYNILSQRLIFDKRGKVTDIYFHIDYISKNSGHTDVNFVFQPSINAVGEIELGKGNTLNMTDLRNIADIIEKIIKSQGGDINE